MPVPGAKSLELPDANPGDAQGASSCSLCPSRPSIERATAFPGPRSTAITSTSARRSTTRSRRCRTSAPDLVVAHGGRGAPSLVPPRGARLPDRHLLRILFRQQPSRHLVPDRPAAGRARAVFSPIDQRPDSGDARRLRRRLFGNPVAEAVVSRKVPSKIDVYFDGIDTDALQPRPRAPADRRRGRSRAARRW